MATLTTRAGKGSELTWAEVDANFSDLNTEVRTADKGGTGHSSFTVGDLFYADTTTTLAKLPAGTLKAVLRSNGAGVAPSWGAIDLGTSVAASGTLTVGRGGTGVATLTGIVKGNGTGAFTAAAAGTDYVAPSGALGTPASGDLTNCTFPFTPITPTTLNNGTLPASFTSLNGGPLAGFRNRIINGEFGVWQRGTTFSGSVHNADRWTTLADETVTTSQQALALGTIAGYESPFYQRTAKSAGGTYVIQEQRIDDVRTLAGQTVTLSFWAKADSAVTTTPKIGQYFGTGGSPSASVEVQGSIALTTSWARYSFTATLGSISGKTIGSTEGSSYLYVRAIRVIDALAHTIDICGVQLEPGTVATPFEARPIPVELSMCQRFGFRINDPSNANTQVGTGPAATTNVCSIYIPVPIPLRVKPSYASFTAAGWEILDATTFAVQTVTAMSIPFYLNGTLVIYCTVASGLTVGKLYVLRQSNNAAAVIDIFVDL